MNKHGHLYLKNKKGKITELDKSRAIKNNNIETKNPELYTSQKRRLKQDYINFGNNRSQRHKQRNLSLDIPQHIDYVKIFFYPTFNDSSNNTQSLILKFRKAYGLIPVAYEDFNKTVLFSIDNDQKFETFKEHLSSFYDSGTFVDPHEKPYSLIINIHSFEFLSSNGIKKWFREDVAFLDLFDSAEILEKKENILQSLQDFLRSKNISYFFLDSNAIELKNTTKEVLETIIDNFDIVHKVYSHKYKTRRPGTFGGSRAIAPFDLITRDNLPKVAILDTGIQINSAIGSAIQDLGLDFTSPDSPLAIYDEHGHGTSVAGVTVLGQEFYKQIKSEYSAAAVVIPVKLFQNGEGIFSLNDLEITIRFLFEEHGVRIFNLSVGDSIFKKYNEPVSKYAYLLDKLTYKLEIEGKDILMFIATGNYNFDGIEDLSQQNDESLQYPNHFFHSSKDGSSHYSEWSNLHSPSESMNNLTVGAIADNFEGTTDLTLDKSLPAYYTLKHHYDYSKKINEIELPKSIRNKNLIKPDVCFHGGDAIKNEAGLNVISNNPQELTEKTIGTSLATPFASNLAAKIIGKYPKLKMQTVKALIINSAERTFSSNFLETTRQEILKEESESRYKTNYDSLDRNQKRKLHELFNKDRMYERLIGHGLPDENLCLNSSDNEVVFIIEDSIKSDTQQITTLKFPEYLRKKDQDTVLTITATLCYKFNPIFENQLAYNPLHIAFKFTRLLTEDLDESLKISTNSRHSHYEKFYEEGMSDKDKASKRSEERGIQSNDFSWSEDFFPVNGRLFSNVQKTKNYNIRKRDLSKTEDAFAILFRATVKNDGIEGEILEELQRKEHPYSLVIAIKEKSPSDEFCLRDELILENNCENIAILDSTLDAES